MAAIGWSKNGFELYPGREVYFFPDPYDAWAGDEYEGLAFEADPDPPFSALAAAMASPSARMSSLRL